VLIVSAVMNGFPPPPRDICLLTSLNTAITPFMLPERLRVPGMIVTNAGLSLFDGHKKSPGERG